MSNIEKIAQRIIDLFFGAGARVSKKHYDEVVSMFISLRATTIEECVEALPNEVGPQVRNWTIAEAEAFANGYNESTGVAKKLLQSLKNQSDKQ